MDQLRELRDAAAPDEVLFVVDAMTGQDAVRTAEEFMTTNQTGGRCVACHVLSRDELTLERPTAARADPEDPDTSAEDLPVFY